MAEFRNPSQVRDEGGRSLVALTMVVVFLFVGLQWMSTAKGTGPTASQAQQVSIVGVSKVDASTSGSMNVVERGLFVPLAFIRAHVFANRAGSWGWSIVLLTFGINLLLLPLRIGSMRSGLRMQRIQPEVEAIKARYKDVKLTDPRHNDMAAEMAKLQKEHGVNPLGGCLPLVIQMPLLIAFFGMLRKAAVLRGAGWLWLHDLSVADPYHILPVLMIAFQMLVQLYTPSPGSDAKQQKTVTAVMAVVFGYISWHYASGVALYALTGSLLSLAMQAAMNCTALGREMKALRAGDGG